MMRQIMSLGRPDAESEALKAEQRQLFADGPRLLGREPI